MLMSERRCYETHRILMLVWFISLTFAQDAEGIIRQVLEAQLTVPHMRTITEGETTSSNPDMPASLLGKSTIIHDFIAPDKLRMTMYDADGNLSSDTIILKEGVYVLNEAGEWEVDEPMMYEIAMSAREMVVHEIVISNAQKLADEVLDGIDCDVYSYDSELRNIVAQNKLWISKATGLVLQQESSSVFGDDLYSTTLSKIDYDTPITIVAPF